MRTEKELLEQIDFLAPINSFNSDYEQGVKNALLWMANENDEPLLNEDTMDSLISRKEPMTLFYQHNGDRFVWDVRERSEPMYPSDWKFLGYGPDEKVSEFTMFIHALEDNGEVTLEKMLFIWRRFVKHDFCWSNMIQNYLNDNYEDEDYNQ